MSNGSNIRSGLDAISLLGVALVVLKLTGVITWSWFWIILPFWGEAAIVVLVVLGLVITNYIKAQIRKRQIIKDMRQDD